MSVIPQFNQREFVKLCGHLGLEIITRGGKGSHVKIRNPNTGRMLIVPRKLKKGLTIRLVKDLEQWGFDRNMLLKLLS